MHTWKHAKPEIWKNVREQVHSPAYMANNQTRHFAPQRERLICAPAGEKTHVVTLFVNTASEIVHTKDRNNL